MKTKWLEKSFTYDGTQLHSLFAYMEHGVLGDSIIAWRGSCEISFEHMLDGEDVLAQSPIRGSDMLHFIVEFFPGDLLTGVALQRLLASLCHDLLASHLPPDARHHRDGDDVFVDDKKFSISIATVSPVSTLIHFAVNCRNEGTPVPTCALSDFGVEPKAFAAELMQQFSREFSSVQIATKKVRWVK